MMIMMIAGSFINLNLKKRKQRMKMIMFHLILKTKNIHQDTEEVEEVIQKIKIDSFFSNQLDEKKIKKDSKMKKEILFSKHKFNCFPFVIKFK